MNCTRIVLADTQGVGKPGQVGELINLIDENNVPMIIIDVLDTLLV